MARFLGAVFVIAVGTILYVGQGLETLDAKLTQAGAGQVEKAKLDQVLTGSPGALDRTANKLDPGIRDAFVSGARQGIVDGFTDSMWLIAIVGLAGALLGFWLLRPDQRSNPRP
jgi:hypothetical protein